MLRLMSTQRLVAAVMAAGVSGALTDAGFVRKALVFRRPAAEGATNVVEVLVARARTAGEAEIVLNLGTYLPAVEAVLHARKIKAPGESEGTVRTRVGPPGKKRDPWWRVVPGKEANVASRVVAAIEDGVLPWFAVTSDLGALNTAVERELTEAFWMQNRLAPAAIALCLGKKTLAKKRVRAVETSIRATLAERAAEFGKRDPFGSDVLKLVVRLRNEHALGERPK